MQILERILEITLSDFHDEEQLLNKYLELGLEIFKLDTGIISKIKDDSYTVRKIQTTFEGINEGDIFPLKDTFCRFVIESKKVVAINNAGKIEKFKSHPAYENMRLESYVSAPIYVNGAIYGTINFSSQNIIEETSSPKNINYIVFLAKSIGRALESLTLRLDNNRVLNILNETGAIAKVGGWEMEVETGNLTWTNETFKIFELEKKQGQTPVLEEGLQMYVDEHVPIITEAVNDAVEHGTPYHLELQAKTTKGDAVWVSTNGKANYKDGKVVTLSGTIQVIQEQKETAQKLEEERAKSMHNAKLASLGEMSAGIAHEINNPLAIILGCVTLMGSKSLDENRMKDVIKKMRGSIERIAKIVNGLKKFSRSSDVIDIKNISLRKVCYESIALIEAKAKRNDVDILVEIDDSHRITADELQVEQVLVNLLSNAIDGQARREGSWVKISHQISGDYDQIIVSDSGVGISKELIPKLFDPFFTTKEVGKGTGLGLSISKGIAKDHNGDLEYKLIDGHTAFIFSIPKSD